MPDTRVLYDPDPVPGWQLQADFVLGSVSCTAFAGEVCTDRNTFGKTKLTGKAIRIATGDKSGGTTVQQIDDAILKLTGDDNLSTGYYRWHEVAALIATEGKGFLVAMRYTKVHEYGLRQLAAGVKQDDLISGQENGFTGPTSWHAQTWHCWLQPGESRVIRGKKLTAPKNERGLVVLDPLCDGRRPTVAKGPVVYPESLVLAIVADSLLADRTYGAITLDARYTVSEPPPVRPVRTLKFGSRPIAKRALKATRRGWKRSSPRISRTDPSRNTVRRLDPADRFVAYQVAQGTAVGGNRKWYGNRGGDHWVNASRFE